MAGFPAYGATILLPLTFATFVAVAVLSFSFGLFSVALLIALSFAIFSFPFSFAITNKADSMASGSLVRAVVPAYAADGLQTCFACR